MKMQKGEHSVVIEVPSDKIDLYLQMGFHKVENPIEKAPKYVKTKPEKKNKWTN